MKAAVFIEPGQVRIEDREAPQVTAPSDAIVKVVRASVCGSDLWFYRGIAKRSGGDTVGHEAIGIVTEVGADVTTLTPGDFVIVPFTHGCGHCAACLAGYDANCSNANFGRNAGYQAEYMRAPNADGALIKIPGTPSDYSEDLLKSFVTLADVMATGYHAAVSADVRPGATAVVFGDGAVGLCGVISAKLGGAERIIIMSRHEDRQRLAREFGATDVVAERGDEAVARVLELTNGVGADATLECVGTAQSTETAFAVARAGSMIGRVGVPQSRDLDVNALFWRNVGLKGGPANVTTYVRQILLEKVLDGSINPGRVFTGEYELDAIQDAYAAMDERRVIKSLVRVADR